MDPTASSAEFFEITVKHGKHVHIVKCSLKSTVADLKREIEALTNIESGGQKLIGLTKLKGVTDGMELKSLQLKAKPKVMVVGTPKQDLEALRPVTENMKSLRKAMTTVKQLSEEVSQLRLMHEDLAKEDSAKDSPKAKIAAAEFSTTFLRLDELLTQQLLGT